MKRRALLKLLGGVAAAPLFAPLAVAQHSAWPVIGWLDSTGLAQSDFRVAAFRRGLNENGYVEGQNVAIDFRWAEGRLDQLPALVAELVRRPVNVLLTQNVTTPTAKAATSTIPIVFVSGGDPVATGLVTNLSRPGANITGVSFFAAPLTPKRLELLSELLPKAAMIAALMDSRSRSFAAERRELETAARGIGHEILIATVGSEPELDAAFPVFVKSGAKGLIVGGGVFFTSRRRQITALATRHALPAIYNLPEFVRVGGLMSYGASDITAYRRAGHYVGRILKGAKPAELPIEMPSKYELIINLATAKALGLEITPKLLALADEVID